jgi:hypothetical protein
LGNLSTPKSVQKLQTALHAKAKAEAGYRFYALYDKISREDILAHAYAQCRSNKGAPGVDSQDFADIEAYGVQRWLGELALVLRQETYRPDPIRRVFIPKARTKAYRSRSSTFMSMRAIKPSSAWSRHRGEGIARNQRINPMQSRSPMHLSRRCGARTRRGGRCLSPAMPNGRCRLHGGKSPGAPRGNKNAFRHGRYTAEAIVRRREIAGLILAMRSLAKTSD